MSRKNVAGWFATVLLFVWPSIAGAQTVWTGAGPTAVIDEQSLAIYSANPQYLGYLAGSTSVGDIIAYFNVTDTSGLVTPAWNTLEMGYFDPAAGSQVKASLIQLNPCNGNLNVLCTVTSTDSSAITCARCSFTTPINFATFTYYVQVTISRNATTLSPKLFGVRVF